MDDFNKMRLGSQKILWLQPIHTLR